MVSLPLSQKYETVGNSTTLVTEYYNAYYPSFSAFFFSPACTYWMIIKFLFRDFGLSIALVVINSLILGQMRKSTNRRLKIAGVFKIDNPIFTKNEGGAIAPVTSATASRSVLAAQKAERKRSIMIILTGVNYIVGHSLYIVYTLNTFFFQSNRVDWNCVTLAAKFLLSLAYSTPFFFYYFFNTHFYKIANTNIARFVIPVSKLINPKQSQEASTQEEI
jgi:hypothetical protein